MHRVVVSLAAVLAASVPPCAVASQPGELGARGRFVERVVCAESPDHAYALYLPPGYTTERTWPLLFVFDPRGRAVAAAEIFRPAAERQGWIIMSSADTRSDTTDDVNGPAIRAMWSEAARYGVDSRRVYLAGFSGLVNSAWALAANNPARVAGVIASGGRVNREVSERPLAAAFFGAAGRADFNYLETKRLDGLAARRGGWHRLEIFEGEHEWLPAPMAEEAIAWLEIVAMREQRRPVDRALVAERLAAERGAAVGLERDGRLTEAVLRYEVILRTFEGLADVQFAADRRNALVATREFAQALRNERRWDEWEQREADKRVALALSAASNDETTIVGEVAVALQLASLGGQARRPGYEGDAARRVINALFVETSYYGWREMMRAGRYRRAAFLQQLALEMRPDVAGAWYRLAVSAARAGNRGQALDALDRAQALGFEAVDMVEQEEAFARLRGDSRFDAVLARMRDAGKAH